MKTKHGMGRSRITIASLLILVGVLLILFNVGIIPYAYKSLIFSWQMLLIVIGVISLINKHFINGVVLLTVGCFFITSEVSKVFPDLFGNFSFDISSYWPAIIIAVGLTLLWKPQIRKKRLKKYAEKNVSQDIEDTYTSIPSRVKNSADVIEKNVAFSSVEQVIFSSDFKGGEVNVAFGSLKLDLRKADLSSQNYLEINAAFGSVVLYVPEHWNINMITEIFLGGIDDKRRVPQTPAGQTSPVLYLKCASCMGSIEIKN